MQKELQNKSTLEPTLLLLVIVSRIVNSRNKFRSFPQPASAPRKAFTQKEFTELSPSVRLFVKAKTCFYTSLQRWSLLLVVILVFPSTGRSRFKVEGMLGGKLCVLVWTNFQYLESAKTCRHKAKELSTVIGSQFCIFPFLKFFIFV